MAGAQALRILLGTALLFAGTASGLALYRLQYDSDLLSHPGIAAHRLQSPQHQSRQRYDRLGEDLLTPVNDDYAVPARFTGKIREVTVTIK